MSQVSDADELPYVDEVYASRSSTPSTSVVIVTYDTPQESFERLIASLREQEGHDSDFEVVVVDNGVDFPLADVAVRVDEISILVQCSHNVGVTKARNLGAALARGDLLVFVDDDAVLGDGFLDAHRAVHADHDIVACRGRVVPRDDRLVNRLQSHYDLGPTPKPHVLDIEGNTSIRKDAFAAVGGFDTDLHDRAGHEGHVLTYHLLKAGYDRDQIIYHPTPVIYHNYVSNIFSYLEKQRVNSARNEFLEQKYPDIQRFRSQYDAPTNEEASTLEQFAVRNTRRLARLYFLASRRAGYDHTRAT